MKLKVNGRIWIDGGKGIFIGKGRADLLEKIEQYGSLSRAAKSMKMSYRQAWAHINDMNKQSSKPLVIKTSGGNGGGGSKVTEEGLKALKLYRKTIKQFELFMQKESKKIN